MSRFVLGIDIGGTGSRVALAALDGSGTGAHSVVATLTGPRVEIGAHGSNALLVANRLVTAARETWPERFASVTGIGIGATGVASLSVDSTADVHQISADARAPTVMAIDAVTAHLGALGGKGGAVVVLGTGAIAVAHPGADDQGTLPPRWSRADGWGHLFGDRGGGAWVGRRALELALRTHDGVSDDGQPLLEAATRRFGPPTSWPSKFYTRNDRAGLLAEFAVDVAELGRSGDAVAAALMQEAGREAARSALAAADTSGPCTIALTGGLVQAGEHLLSGFRAEAARLSGNVVIMEPEGDPLHGALILGRLAAQGKVRDQDQVLWT